MAYKETMDNVFSFSMPAKNVIIYAEFAETGDGADNAETVYEQSEITDAGAKQQTAFFTDKQNPNTLCQHVTMIPKTRY